MVTTAQEFKHITTSSIQTPATERLNGKQDPCLIPETVFHHDFYDRESTEP